MTATVTPITAALGTPTPAQQHFPTVGSDGWTFDAETITARHCAIDLEAWLLHAAPAPQWARGVTLNQANGHDELAQLLVDRVDENGNPIVVKITIEVE
jgi:hypothetical protein